MAAALGIIRHEHRALTSAVRTLERLAHEVADPDARPDYEMLGLLIDYIDAFPNRFHHPKEDRYLFRAVRARSPEAGATLDALEAEHARADTLTRDLRHQLLRCRLGGAGAREAFVTAVQMYADFHWQHMRTEEDVVMPLAERVLTPEDWRTIDHAFEANADPLLGAGPREEFERLLMLIVNAAPAPIGVGPAWPRATTP